jgi:hypothetical protein
MPKKIDHAMDNDGQEGDLKRGLIKVFEVGYRKIGDRNAQKPGDGETFIE